jgi:hypothetical protein
MDDLEEKIDVTDLYHACYLLVNGCKLIGVECLPLAGTVGCRLSMSGRDVGKLCAEYYEQRATVNLYAFRQAYNQINSYIHQAKKSYDKARRDEKRGGL